MPPIPVAIVEIWSAAGLQERSENKILRSPQSRALDSTRPTGRVNKVQGSNAEYAEGREDLEFIPWLSRLGGRRVRARSFGPLKNLEAQLSQRGCWNNIDLLGEPFICNSPMQIRHLVVNAPLSPPSTPRATPFTNRLLLSPKGVLLLDSEAYRN